jgi:hypothetical protein
MSTGRRISRKGRAPKTTLQSLRYSYAVANRQASDLIRAFRDNPMALLDLQGEIERGADRANAIAMRANSKANRS